MDFDFKNKSNTFIFEGIDFSGKTTASKYFAEKLGEKYGEDNVLWLRSPGGSPRAELMRERTRSADLDIYEQCEAYLDCFESTAAYLDGILKEKPMLFVIDRWLPSFEIYQYSKILEDQRPQEEVQTRIKAFKKRYDKLMSYNFGSTKQATLFNLFLFQEDYLRRKKASATDRTETKDRFEKSDEEFQLSILYQYQKLANSHFSLCYNLKPVKANGTPEQVRSLFDLLLCHI